MQLASSLLFGEVKGEVHGAGGAGRHCMSPHIHHGCWHHFAAGPFVAAFCDLLQFSLPWQLVAEH